MFENLTMGDRNRVIAACKIIKATGQVRVSCLQRRLYLNWTDATRIIDLLDEAGIIGTPNKQEYYTRPIYSDKLEEVIGLQEKEVCPSCGRIID